MHGETQQALQKKKIGILAGFTSYLSSDDRLVLGDQHGQRFGSRINHCSHLKPDIIYLFVGKYLKNSTWQDMLLYENNPK